MLLRRSDGWRELTVYKGSLPELTLPDGGTVCQSMAIARWAARMASAGAPPVPRPAPWRRGPAPAELRAPGAR